MTPTLTESDGRGGHRRGGRCGPAGPPQADLEALARFCVGRGNVTQDHNPYVIEYHDVTSHKSEALVCFRLPGPLGVP